MDAAAQRKPVYCDLARKNRARLIRLIALGLVVTGLVTAPAVAAGSAASPPPKPDLRPLWKGYPLDPGAGHVEQTSPMPRPTPATNDGSGGEAAPLAALAAVSGVVLVALVAAFLVLQTRWTLPLLTKGARMTRFTSRRSKREAVAYPTAENEQAAARVDPDLTEAKAVPSDVEPPEATSRRAAPEDAPERATPHDTGRVAAHVETVLQAAEDAAGRMIEEARAEAEQIRAGAERQAASELEAAQATATRLQEEAERAHAEALAAAAEARRAAKDDAASLRAQAEEHVTKMRSGIEREAASARAAAESHYEDLLSDTAFAEGRLRRLVGGLREVADRLDNLLEPEETGSAEMNDDALDEPDEVSFVEALEPGETRSGIRT